ATPGHRHVFGRTLRVEGNGLKAVPYRNHKSGAATKARKHEKEAGPPSPLDERFDLFQHKFQHIFVRQVRHSLLRNGSFRFDDAASARPAGVTKDLWPLSGGVE